MHYNFASFINIKLTYKLELDQIDQMKANSFTNFGNNMTKQSNDKNEIGTLVNI